MRLTLEKPILLRLIVAILVVLNLGNFAAQYLLHFTESPLAGPIEALFSFDRESNPVTVFNALLLLMAAILALSIGQWRRIHQHSWWRAWIGIALILAFLFVDELAGIHDSLDFVLARRLETSGAFDWPWVIAYSFLTLAVVFAYLRFFFALPARHRWRFALAAILYVGGAIGLEMVAAAHVDATGKQDVFYAALFTIEENLEMLACLLAILGLLDYIERECPGFDVTIAADTRS